MSNHRSPSRIERSAFSVFRPVSVSSILSKTRPPEERANSQLNTYVRAPPTCSNPVGEGANRTRFMNQ